ncbi:hypothetical protein [Paraburkholderia graminis]|uniref:hypothetical protein n=1 Tax=Paraburkholderia graminis TaxID=60548 RepID=UPI0038BC6586
MNRAFVVTTYGANPVNATALRLSLNLLAVAVHAEDMGAVSQVFGEMLAADAWARGSVGVGERHYLSAPLFSRGAIMVPRRTGKSLSN